MSFLNGNGHSAVQIKYNNENIIIDINEAGIPLNNEKYLSIDNLKSITSQNLKQIKLNIVSDEFNQYFNKEIISKVEFGKSKQTDLEKYYRFIEFIYIPLGNSKFEKIFYDSIAIFYGYFPNTYVSREFYDFFKNEIFYDNAIAYILFFTFHLNYILLCIGVLFYICKKSYIKIVNR